MNKDFRMGILEMVILLISSKGDIYGYDITQHVFNLLSINEGISYPLIKKLTNDGFLESYYENLNNLDSKKYYHLTENGIIKLQKYITDYQEITNRINDLMKGNESNE